MGFTPHNPPKSLLFYIYTLTGRKPHRFVRWYYHWLFCHGVKSVSGGVLSHRESSQVV